MHYMYCEDQINFYETIIHYSDSFGLFGLALNNGKIRRIIGLLKHCTVIPKPSLKIWTASAILAYSETTAKIKIF